MGHAAGVGDKENACTVLVGKREGWSHIQDLGKDRRIILKINLETRWDGRPWTERICLRTGTSGELLTSQQGTFGMHQLIQRISSIGNELLAFTDGPCSVALFRFNPHFPMNHEYCSLPLDLQNRYFPTKRYAYISNFASLPCFLRFIQFSRLHFSFNVLEKRAFRVQLTKSVLMRMSFLCYFISLSGPAYYFTLFYEYKNGDKLINP